MTIWLWVGFIVLVLGLLALDLGVFHRKAHVIGIREALAWTGFWIVLALVFNVAVYYIYKHHWLGIGVDLDGHSAALQFFTGYVIEKSLSLDNIFVIALIFAYFKVPGIHQHRVLFWGIVGALVMRGIMILAGAALIQRFDWMVYVFGGLLLLTAVKMLVVRHDNLSPEKNPLFRLARRLYPVSSGFHGGHFFTMVDGQRAITPLFLVLIVVESSDLLFAVDSIPAIFAITTDPFLVFTSNVFAILGLRSLYFALAGMIDRFRYLKISLVFVLAYVGVKMLLSHHHPIPTFVSLSVIGGILFVGVVASMLPGRRDSAPPTSPPGGEAEGLAQFTVRHAKRVVMVVIGMSVLLVGIALLVLPGPAILVIPFGLAILGTEFLWARRLLRRIKREGGNLMGAMGFGKGAGRGSSPRERREGVPSTGRTDEASSP